MLKELIAIGMATTLMTAPPQNTNDGTYYQDVNITETYEYETNEVNSVDDLIVGNIYHLYAPLNVLDNYPTQDILRTQNIARFDIDSGTMDVERFGLIRLYNNNLNISFYVINEDNVSLFAYSLSKEYLNGYLDLYFTYYVISNFINEQYQYISASDYLGEKTTTVEPVETEGLYNLAYHFLYSRIYTNTELQGMETTLFGTTINMNMWLSHTTAIVIICLLLIVLIKFVIWLFKIVSGGMLWQ